jgi:SRSO17 transposase
VAPEEAPAPENRQFGRGDEVLAEIQARTAPRFARAEGRERAGRYLVGLLDRVERKNGWQLAEAIGETGPQGVQRLLNTAVWDAEGVRDELRGYVVDALGERASGVLIVDETGFLKKGTHSCGVARQYTGTAGTTTNAQVGVFLTYASAKGAAFIDRALYLPRSWTQDPQRRAAAGIPKGTRFATKLTLAQRMLARAFAARVPARWVTADSGYGRSHAFRRWLEQRDQAYAIMIPKTTAVEYQGRRERAEQLGERLPEDAWITVPTREDGHVTLAHQGVCLPLSAPCLRPVRRAGAAGCLSAAPRTIRATWRTTWRMVPRRRPWTSWCGSATGAGPSKRTLPRPRARWA